MLLIVVEYGRISLDIKGNLMALRECINEFNDSKVILIINKVPSEYNLSKSNPPQTLDMVISDAKKIFFQTLNMAEDSSLDNIIILKYESEENHNEIPIKIILQIIS